MSVQRISSFKTFTELKGQQQAAKLHEEGKTKRAEIVSKIGAALEEMGVTSLQELDEEKRTALISKIFNEDKAEDIEKDINDLGEPEKHSEEEGEKVEADLEEGNSFIYAAAKAKAEGKNEFEHDGKKFKVTLKKHGLKESVLITEGTRGFFGKIDKSGNIKAVYTHYDSYPEWILPVIKKNYKNAKAVDDVIAKGDNSGLDAIDKMNFYNDGGKPMIGKADNIKKFIKDATDSSAEFVYLYDERDKKWYMADTYEDKALKPAFEGLDLEGEELNEARSINKIQTEWSKVTAEMAAKAKDYKSAEGDAKAKVLDELKALTAKKKSLEAELDAAISDKDKDLELAVSEGNEFSGALKKAKEAGEEEFEVDGKTYKVESFEINEAKYDKKKLLQIIKGKDDILVTTKNGDEFILYAPDNGNDENTAYWNSDKYVVGVIPDDGDEVNISYGDIVKVEESAVTEAETNEAEVKSDEDFKEYAFTLLKKAFADDFDEAKAQEVVDGILAKANGDYGDAVGMLSGSLGESVDEKKSDGTISDDEEEKEDSLMANVESSIDDLIALIKKEANEIGGSFRAPGIESRVAKLIKAKLQKAKLQ